MCPCSICRHQQCFLYNEFLLRNFSRPIQYVLSELTVPAGKAEGAGLMDLSAERHLCSSAWEWWSCCRPNNTLKTLCIISLKTALQLRLWFNLSPRMYCIPSQPYDLLHNTMPGRANFRPFLLFVDLRHIVSCFLALLSAAFIICKLWLLSWLKPDAHCTFLETNCGIHKTMAE